jgi:long-chain acyl-CoA synthetase
VEPTGSTPTADTRCAPTPAEEAELDRLLAAAPASMAAMFLNRVHDTPHAEALRSPLPDGTWRSDTWQRTGTVVTEIAAGLLALGLDLEDRVALASTTRVDWIHADLGILCAGGATTTVYPTSTTEDVHHIVADSGARFAIVEDAGQLAKLAGLPVERVILIDGDPPAGTDAVLSLAQLRELGRARLAEDPDLVSRTTATLRSDHLATLIYTSGTTGRPKGVRLLHRSWVYEGCVIVALDLARADDLSYVWLPLSHCFGKVLLAGQIAAGHAAAVDGRVDQIIANLPVVRPTAMPGAPRIFEKVHAGVLAKVRAEGGAKLRIFTWAMGVGAKVSRLRQQGQEPSGLLAVQHAIADRLVFSTVRARFGGRVRFFISGSAPLPREVAEWFHSVGMLLVEGYGLTETTAGACVARLDRVEFGTVGRVMPGSRLRIDTDGEVLVQGPNVMAGYHQLPDATAEVLADGWFRTGDIGEITEQGNLRITDRKKDLIKTSGGKYVAPQVLETRFKVLCPLANGIVVHGDGRNFITALIALDPDALTAWAAAQGRDGSFAELARSPEVRAVVQGAVDQLNAGLGRWETIKKFEIIDRELTIEAGDLTPSMKLKRKHVEKQYGDVLDRFYAEG